MQRSLVCCLSWAKFCTDKVLCKTIPEHGVSHKLFTGKQAKLPGPEFTSTIRAFLETSGTKQFHFVWSENFAINPNTLSCHDVVSNNPAVNRTRKK